MMNGENWMSMGGWGMGGGITMLLIATLLVLAIAALIKYLTK
jgi:hypothetical protein